MLWGETNMILFQQMEQIVEGTNVYDLMDLAPNNPLQGKIG